VLENIIAVHMTQLKDSEIDRLAEVNACIHTYTYMHYEIVSCCGHDAAQQE
jgi:hypothetical protein